MKCTHRDPYFSMNPKGEVRKKAPKYVLVHIYAYLCSTYSLINALELKNVLSTMQHLLSFLCLMMEVVK